MDLVVLLLIVVAVAVAIGWQFLTATACETVARQKGRSDSDWFWLGLIFGAAALVILVFLDDMPERFPVAGSRRPLAGKVTCPRCGLIVPFGPRCQRCASPLPLPADSPAGLAAARVDPASPVTWHDEAGG